MTAGKARADQSTLGVSIGINGIRKALGGKSVLDGIDLTVQPGEFLTLLGPSGSGKTTLLMTIAGFTRPDAGAIAFDGSDVTGLPPHQRNIGFVFQSYALFPHLSIADNIAYPLKLRGVGKSDRHDHVREALAMVRLEGFGERSIGSLSGGQRQRVALARAIVFKPKILLMDEPLSALDKPLREVMQIELRRLHGLLGMTTIYVTHDQREALSLSDRVAVMDGGRILQIGAPMELYSRPHTTFVARFIGDSSILPVIVHGNAALFEGRSLTVASSATNGPHGLLIRPERLRQLQPGEQWEELNRFDGTVSDVIVQGDSVLIAVRLAGGQLISMRRPTSRAYCENLPAPGDAIVLGLHHADSILVAPGPDERWN